jgi:hypothetical protein
MDNSFKQGKLMLPSLREPLPIKEDSRAESETAAQEIRGEVLEEWYRGPGGHGRVLSLKTWQS